MMLLPLALRLAQLLAARGRFANSASVRKQSFWLCRVGREAIACISSDKE
jgi:hypothetical protein